MLLFDYDSRYVTFRENVIRVPWPHSVCYWKIVEVYPFDYKCHQTSGQPVTGRPKRLQPENWKLFKSAFEVILQLSRLIYTYRERWIWRLRLIMYPIHNILDFNVKLADTKIFTTLDMIINHGCSVLTNISIM